MTALKYSKPACYLLAAMLLPTALWTTKVSATTYKYDLVGDMRAALYTKKHNFKLERWYPQGAYFHMDINQGDVVLSYDDKGTDSLADDSVSITGTSSGCIGNAAGSNCAKKFGKRHAVWGTHKGTGIFEWDLLLENPILGQTTGGDAFAFDQQQAGKISLLNGKPGVPKNISVMLKRDKTFAFKLFEDLDANGIFDAEGWLALSGGVLGAAGARGEFGKNNSQLNWNLSLIAHGDMPPGEPVPEPGSVLLLSSGLLLLKRRKSQAEMH